MPEFFGGLAQGLRQGANLGLQKRQMEGQRRFRAEQLDQQDRQFNLQHELEQDRFGLERQKFDATLELQRGTEQRQQKLLELQAKEADLLVMDRWLTVLSPNTPAASRGFLIKEMARMGGIDPRSERVQDLTKFIEKADADTRAAMSSVLGQLEGLPAGQGEEFSQMVLSGKISLHELLKLGMEASRPEGFTLSPGQTRFEGDQPVASVPPEPSEFTLGEGQQRFRGSDPIAEGRPSQPQMGTIPPGHQLQRGEDGESFQMTPIPGSPAELEQKEAQRARREQMQQKGKYGDVVTEDIGRGLKLIDEAILPTTGVGGAILQNIPNTAARDLQALLDTIRSNIGFDRLTEMREASPTGGALGQVSNFENRLLQATLGNLEQSQTKDQLVNNLKRIRQMYLDTIHGVGNWRIEYDGSIALGPAGKGQGVKEMSDEELLELLQEEGG